MSPFEIHEMFERKKLTNDQQEKINLIRIEATAFLKFLEKSMPICRRSSIAKTKLEEAVMFAIKAICNPDGILVRL